LKRRKPLSAKTRKDVWDADRIPGTRFLPWTRGYGYAVCRYCGGPVRWDDPWELGHEYSVKNTPFFIPRRWRDGKINLGVTHRRCNRRAGAKNMTFWQSISLRWKIRLIIILMAFFVASLFWGAYAFSQ